MADTIVVDEFLYARALSEIVAVRRTKYPQMPESEIRAAAAALFAAALRFATEYYGNCAPRPMPVRSVVPSSLPDDSQRGANTSAERVRYTMQQIASSSAVRIQFDLRARLVGFFTRLIALREETAREIVDDCILGQQR